ncbi:MAG: hypothetical protein Q9227_005557 [Pyrenula ochraceoflavens]
MIIITSSTGVLNFNKSLTVTLTQPVVFVPQCTGVGFIDQLCTDNTISDPREPFYASTSPQIYALATTTVLAYVLVVMLFITPRTFFVGGQGGGAKFLDGRGFMRSTGNPSVISIGNRPWLQKFAALSVAASLTIASADTFRIAEKQYDSGYTDSSFLVDQVAASLEIRIVRVISTTFLWLAQVQTLIRLFPRHKEKVVIKWLGFALIVLDTIFTTLNNFVHSGTKTRPRSFQDAIPALSYLFELSISFIYASCVVYYTISKRRFAFFHSKMRNIGLVALIALTAVLIPVVFFVLDISKPNVAGWGDYVRWVGAAAASVVVWEWVERIEALERDERKDGVLGREVFDGDDMLGMTLSGEVDGFDKSNGYPRRRLDPTSEDHDRVTSRTSDRSNFNLRTRIPFHLKSTGAHARAKNLMAKIIPPPPAITPINRAETTSAASTVYNIRYHPVTTPPGPAPNNARESLVNIPKQVSASSSGDTTQAFTNQDRVGRSGPIENLKPSSTIHLQPLWRSMPNPFKRRRGSPPAEIAGAQKAEDSAVRAQRSTSSLGARKTIGVRSRIDKFANIQREKLKDRTRGHDVKLANLPVTIIPAPVRGRTWSPEDLELGEAAANPARGSSPSSNGNINNAAFLDNTEQLTASGRPQNGPPINLTPAPARRSHIDPTPLRLPRTPTTGSTTIFGDESLHSPRQSLRRMPSRSLSDSSAGFPSPRGRFPRDETARQDAEQGPILSRRGALTFEETDRRGDQPAPTSSFSYGPAPNSRHGSNLRSVETDRRPAQSVQTSGNVENASSAEEQGTRLTNGEETQDAPVNHEELESNRHHHVVIPDSATPNVMLQPDPGVPSAPYTSTERAKSPIAKIAPEEVPSDPHPSKD